MVRSNVVRAQGRIPRAMAGAAAVAALCVGSAGALGQTLPGQISRLADTAAGVGSGLYSTDFVVAGGFAYFRAQGATNSLWRTTGRPGGTVQIDTGVTNDAVGIGDGRAVYLRSANASGPAGLYLTGPSGAPMLIAASATGLPIRAGYNGNVRVLNGRVLFMAGGALWAWEISSGAIETLVGPASITGSTIAEVTILGQRALVVRTATTGKADILSTDCTAAGTTQIKELPVAPRWSTALPALTTDDTSAYFAFTSPVDGPQVWTTNGTELGTHRVALMPTSTLTTSVWSARNASGVYWGATIGSSVQLWHFGPVDGDAQLLLNFSGTTTRMTPLGSANGMSLFGDSSGTYTQQNQNATLWASMGTVNTTLAALRVLPAGQQGNVTTLPVDGTTGTASSPTTLSVGDEVYFLGNTLSEGTEVWHVNTATGSMGVLADLTPGTASTTARAVFAMGAGAVGVITSPTTGTQGNRVWMVDSAGARWIASPGTFPTTIRPVTMGRRVLMGVNVAGSGTEPYVLDLCPADYDNSGGAPTSNDIFAFLNDWLAADRNADFDNSGGAPTAADIFAFINAWMTGCP